MKKGDNCYIIVTCEGVTYNGYPVCKIRKNKVVSSGKKFTLVDEKDAFSSKDEKHPQFFTETGERNWTPKNIHDFNYNFYLIDEDTYAKSIDRNIITFNNIQYIIR